MWRRSWLVTRSQPTDPSGSRLPFANRQAIPGASCPWLRLQLRVIGGSVRDGDPVETGDAERGVVGELVGVGELAGVSGLSEGAATGAFVLPVVAR